ncbi:MAG: class I SAM-dependent methyltransferase [Chthoniobacteraceae bacterium]
MEKEQIVAIFDQQAATYDRKWSELSAINVGLHLLASSVLGELPSDARILCVGAGTGAEILSFAKQFPDWHFTAVEPSRAMLDVLRARAKEHGITSRCEFHEGYLETLPAGAPFHAATSFLVSQFIQDRDARIAFFRGIGERLLPKGILLSSDLAGDMASPECDSLLKVWFHLMKGGGLSAEELKRMREAYERDVAVLPPADVCEVIRSGGFEPPVRFFQAGMIHAWFATRG